MIKEYKLLTSNLNTAIDMLKAMLSDNAEVELNAKPWKAKRSLSQNALLHMWMSELSKYLISKGRDQATPEWCKEAMKHTFLGYEMRNKTNVITGEIFTTSELKRTRDLNTGEMTHFLDRIYNWALNINCFLTIPENSEYAKLTEQQNK